MPPVGQRLVVNVPATAVLGHDLADHDQVVIYVACTSHEVKAKVASRWNVGQAGARSDYRTTFDSGDRFVFEWLIGASLVATTAFM